jgi:hypothetical protein
MCQTVEIKMEALPRSREIEKVARKGLTVLKFLAPLVLGLLFATCSAQAEVEQTCRFVPAKAEREACYQRQDAALAEKRKQAVARDAAMTTPPSLEQMSTEDVALRATLRSICRGC